MAECAFVSTRAPFYIPPQGYMPKPGEVITEPVTAGPCTDQPENDQARDDDQKPDTPDIPSGDPNAKPLEGNYTATVTDGGQRAPEGSTKPVVFTPCGPACTRMAMPPGTADLHLQGTTWSGTYSLEGARNVHVHGGCKHPRYDRAVPVIRFERPLRADEERLIATKFSITTMAAAGRST